MSKTAETDYPIHPALAERWSPLSFLPDPVSRVELASLFEAARWAASCFNEQPWRFIVTTEDEPEARERLRACVVDANRRWADAAPVLMLSVASTSFARNDKPNRHGAYDVGQAVANLATQATALGLAIHQMAGFDAERAREAFSIPEGYEPMAVIAVGYPGEPGALEEDLRDREKAPRVRRPLEEIAFESGWGEGFQP